MTVQDSAPDVAESTWRKSSYSTGNGGECVEVATSGAVIRVRDSKDVAGPVLTVTPEAWDGFVAMARVQLG